jgi:hypothetical protein
MHAEDIVPDGAEGIFNACPLACIPSSFVKLSVHDDVEGAFVERPLACVPNRHLAHVRTFSVFCTGKNMVVKITHSSSEVVW